MRAILIFFYRTTTKSLFCLDSIFNCFMLNLTGVCYGKKLRITGKIFLRNKGSITIGDNCIINSKFSSNPIGGNVFSSIVVDKSANLNIGDNTGISNTAIFSQESISIGNNVLIGGDCKIYDTDFHSTCKIERLDATDRGRSKEVVIGEHVFIGTGCIILKGSNIGSGSIIGAGSVVTGVIPPDQLWAGNPVKFIKHL